MKFALIALLAGSLLWARVSQASDDPQPGQHGALLNLGLGKFAQRYTFLIDPQDKIAKAYLKVDTSRHSQEIINDLVLLKGNKP